MKQPRGAAGSDLIFFLFFLIVLGVVWALTGGPGRSISHAGPFLNPPFPLGSGTAYTVPIVPISTSNGSQGNNTTSFGDIFARIRGSFGGSVAATSPYSKDISLSTSVTSSNPLQEYVTLRFSSSMSGTATISDWRLTSQANGISVPLGNAAYLPYSGQVNPEVPVAVRPGSTVYVVTGRSPIGASFRTNTCTAYFAQYQSFSPGLNSNDCPRPVDEIKNAASSGFIPTDACVTYVTGLQPCKMVTASVPQTVGGQCQTFITTSLTYSGCVDLHKNDPGFYKDTWYLYLNRDQELFRNTHDQIVLTDENGKVIASATY